ncbi:MAG: PAS domain S-box protein [Desulfobacteraceae bacterium]|nr:PAS domain S-box protein [Desulfobacteraceae bacterium]
MNKPRGRPMSVMNSRHSLTVALAALLFILAGTVTCGPAHCRQPQAMPNILVLHSYGTGFAWSDEEYAGFIQRIREVYPDLGAFREHLESRRYPGEMATVRIRALFHEKYENLKFDLIVCFDNPALQTALRNRDLFPGVPIVFGGINGFTPAMIEGQRKITGVPENLAIRQTLEIALGLHPGTKQILVVANKSETGLATLAEAEPAIASIGKGVVFRYLPFSSMEEVKDAIDALPRDSLVLLLTFSADTGWQSLSMAQDTQYLTADAPVPAYSAHAVRLGHGIVGGVALAGRDHGRQVADVALRVLGGEDPDSIPIPRTPSGKPMFDYVQLKKWNIPLEALPSDSFILNKPVTLWEENRDLVLGVAATIGALILLVAGLTFLAIRNRAADAALRASEERFRAIFEHAGVGVCMTATDTGRFLVVNRKFCEIVGYTNEEMLGKTLFDLTHPEDLEACRASMHEMFLTGRGYGLEKRYIHKDGSTVWIFLSAAAIHGFGNALPRSVGIIHDITDRKKIEESFHRSQRLLQESQALSHVGSWEWDLQTNTRTLSDEMYRIFGYEPGGFEPVFDNFISAVHPADRERVQAAFRKAAETGALYREEFRIIRPDGSEIIVHAEGARSGEEGRQRIIGSTMDITERKLAQQALEESEQRFRLVVQNADAIIVVLDKNGVFQLTEGRALAKIGSYPGRVVGKSMLEVYADVPELVDSVREALSGKPTRSITVFKGIVIDVVHSPLFDSEGNVEGVVGIGIDITERRRAEEALAKSEQQLRMALSASRQGLYDLNVQTGIVEVNPEYEKILGYEAGEIGMNVAEWIKSVHPDDREMVRRTYNDYLAGKRREYRIECRLVNKTGGYRWLLTTGSIMEWDAEGCPLRLMGVASDITERKMTELALKRTQFCIDNMRDSVFWIRGDATFAYVNEASCRGLGYSREELLAMRLIDVDPVFPAAIWPEYWKNVIEEGTAVLETWHKAKDGKAFPVEVSITTMRFAEEVLIAAFARDITERKEAERLLQEREAKLASIFHTAPVGIGLVVRGVIQEVNDAMCRITGFDSAELAGEDFRILQAADGCEQMSFGDGEYTAGGSESVSVETCWVRKDGEKRDIAISAMLLDLFDPAKGYIFAALDITERKLAEKALRDSEYFLRKSQEVARLGSYHMDAVSGNWMSSSTLDEVLGIDGDYEKNVEGWIGLVHPEQQEEMRKYFSEHVLSRHQPFAAEYRIIRPRDGRERWVYGLGELELDANGNTISMFGTIQDITERKLAEEKIRRLNEELEDRVHERTAQLEAANKELEAFAYSVSHDLRAPLRAVDGFTRILTEDYASILGEEGMRVCNVICEEARRMAELIDNLLAYSRMGRVELLPTQINMEELAGAIFEELTTSEDRERIEFHLGTLPPVVSDRTMMRQVWTNLIGNALKFSAKRERPVIDVGAEPQANEIIYHVKDNGAGFDMRYSSKLFGVFQRLHSERDFEGTGVGLAIVQRLIHRHGGRVWAMGEADKGATFYFSLPVKGTGG